MGEERALAIYFVLSSHTRSTASSIDCDRVVYYSDYVDREDNWSNEEYLKNLQEGDELGRKMMHAFEWGFRQHYKRVCIIGTDCMELTPAILKDAFETLARKDVVIGPAVDGGYYLLGMNQFIPQLFINKKWSTETVYNDTVQDLKRLRYTYGLLPTLRDIDHETDLPQKLR